jgi:hypothetical protein
MTAEKVIDICAAMGVEGGNLMAAPVAIIVRLDGLPLCPRCDRRHPRGVSAQCNMGCTGRAFRTQLREQHRGHRAPHKSRQILWEALNLIPPMPPMCLPEQGAATQRSRLRIEQ